MQKEKRGYLLTADNNFLDAYNRATTAFTNYHGYLMILVASRPNQAALLTEIRTDLERWNSTFALPAMDAKLERA